MNGRAESERRARATLLRALEMVGLDPSRVPTDGARLEAVGGSTPERGSTLHVRIRMDEAETAELFAMLLTGEGT